MSAIVVTGHAPEHERREGLQYDIDEPTVVLPGCQCGWASIAVIDGRENDEHQNHLRRVLLRPPSPEEFTKNVDGPTGLMVTMVNGRASLYAANVVGSEIVITGGPVEPGDIPVQGCIVLAAAEVMGRCTGSTMATQIQAKHGIIARWVR